MSIPRRSTVYDLASLRLHTDGTRVYQRSGNLRPTIARVTVQGSRGNWIARDAGGLAVVPKYKKVKVGSEQPDELEADEDIEGGRMGRQDGEGEVEKEQEGSDDEDGEVTGGRDRKRKGKRPDERTLKRRRFVHDDAFLVRQTPTIEKGLSRVSSSGGQSSDQQQYSLPLPSSDLLKCIHYFAAVYYDEQGQLLNISRQYRRERKERRARRRVIANQKQKSSRSRSPHSETSTEDEDNNGNSSESGSDGSLSSNDDEEAGIKVLKGQGRPKRSHQYRDMYKVFDGSALMAIGILVQEYINEALQPRIPDGWEEAVQNLQPGDIGGTSEDDDEGPFLEDSNVEEVLNKDDRHASLLPVPASTEDSAMQNEERGEDTGSDTDSDINTGDDFSMDGQSSDDGEQCE